MRTKQITPALITAAFMLAVAVGLKYAQGLQLIGSETAVRAIQVMIGMSLAVYGNFIPKNIASASCAAPRFQTPARLGGWLFALAGLSYAGLWAFAPVAVANVAAMPIVMAATVITGGYCAWAVLSGRWHHQDRSTQ
jgi:hypothetical protein